jgi:hypothetical protein
VVGLISDRHRRPKRVFDYLIEPAGIVILSREDPSCEKLTCPTVVEFRKRSRPPIRLRNAQPVDVRLNPLVDPGKID